MGAVDFYIALPEDRDVTALFTADPVGLARRSEGALQKIKGSPARIKRGIEARKAELDDTRTGLGKLKVFAEQDKLDALNEQVDALETQLLSEAEKDKKEQRDMSGPVATLRCDELGEWTDMRDLGRKVTAWYRDNLVGFTVTNEESGMKIGFNRTGANKVSGRRVEDLMRIVPALRKGIYADA